MTSKIALHGFLLLSAFPKFKLSWNTKCSPAVKAFVPFLFCVAYIAYIRGKYYSAIIAIVMLYALYSK